MSTDGTECSAETARFMSQLLDKISANRDRAISCSATSTTAPETIEERRMLPPPIANRHHADVLESGINHLAFVLNLRGHEAITRRIYVPAIFADLQARLVLGEAAVARMA
ncbi:hypothetical protein [Bradyrhizobium sp. ARR65]|uniref:hypothetical protein n=1 Tax=Bradyrhizobium sp. ARR65 TaxID=1040989 RepID=UPI0012F80718|nr:hypothetical protein [Bradyrhizobium sp. ARR65]